MKFESPTPNYAATIGALDAIVPLAGCDNVVGGMIFNNQVIISKDHQAGDVGIFFPLESALSKAFLGGNNLFRKPEWGNVDPEAKGFFEEHGRVKALRFRGHACEGFFIPVDSLTALGFKAEDFKVGDEFQIIDGVEVCRKYAKPTKEAQGPTTGKKARRAAKKALKTDVLEGQLAFHYDTAQLRRNVHKITPDMILSISHKFHGTSAIYGNLLLDVPMPTLAQAAVMDRMNTKVTKLTEYHAQNKKGSWLKKQLAKLADRRADRAQARLEQVMTMVRKEIQYGHVITSRTVVKQAGEKVSQEGGFYSENIWTIVGEEIKALIPKGFTIYGEIVGFLPGGAHIQKGYDYGCLPGHHKFYVYRVTFTNADNHVFELDWPMMKQFCAKRGLDTVVEAYYGTAEDFVLKYHPNAIHEPGEAWECIPSCKIPEKGWKNPVEPEFEEHHSPSKPNFCQLFLEAVEHTYLEGDCKFCKNKVPAEGVVIRWDNLDRCEALKSKSFAFFAHETKMLDKGEVDIEAEEA
jgi:hypothetical protein